MTDRIPLSEYEKKTLIENVEFIATGQTQVTELQTITTLPEVVDVPTAQATLDVGQLYTLTGENFVRVVTPP